MQKRESRLGILLILPTVILIGAVIIYPIIYNIILSFQKVALNPNRPSKIYRAGELHEAICGSYVL